MARKPYTRYSREFKLEAVRQAALGEKPKAQIARALGIRVGHLRDWRLQFEEEARTGVTHPPPAVWPRPGAIAAREREAQGRERDLKKSGHLLRGRIEVKYAFIDRHRRSYEVKALCDALQVSRSGYYAARGRAPSARQERQATLTAEIRRIHTASRETYGAPRVHAELCAQNVPCCRNTVAKLMRQAAIIPKCHSPVPGDHRLAPDQGVTEPDRSGVHDRRLPMRVG